jgi:hypothetical protein
MAKQPKQPAFPHPVLETGVPSYPTPNVPDFYTKSGHIILQEKVSVEKGNYTPLPLDGSVVYSGRDASKWPSPLYLVAERPTADGEYSIRYWANDRTYASQDPWNYNVSYSGDDPQYPIYTRTYIVRRSDYSPVTIGSSDPVVGGNAKVVKQEMQELSDDNPMRSLHVAVQVTYESIPGPTLGGFDNRPGLLGTRTISDQIVPPDSTPDSLSTTVVESSIEKISSAKSKKTTITSSGPTLLGGSRVSSRGDVETITEFIVAAGTAADSDSYLLASSEVKPIDGSKSQKTNSAVASYVTLSAAGFNLGGVSSSGAKTSITNQIVNPASYTRPTLGVNDISYTEKPLSPTKIEVTRETLDDTLGYPKIYSSGVNHVSYTQGYSQYTEIVANSSSLLAGGYGGIINEYDGIDKLHAKHTNRNYTNLIGSQWTEYETENYTYPSILTLSNSNWAQAWGLSNIYSYQQSRTLEVIAQVWYSITDTISDSIQPANFASISLVTDLGTYENVLHNAISYKWNNNVVSTIPTSPAPRIGRWYYNKIISRVSITRINGMGGLYLQKVVVVPSCKDAYEGGIGDPNERIPPYT